MKNILVLLISMLAACGAPNGPGPTLSDSCSLPENQKTLAQQSVSVTYDLQFTIDDFPSKPVVTYFYGGTVGPPNHRTPRSFIYKEGEPSLVQIVINPDDATGQWFLHASAIKADGYQHVCSESFTVKDTRR